MKNESREMQPRVFDLTTSEGLKNAAIAATKKDPDLFLLAVPIYGPAVFLGKKLLSKAVELVKDSTDTAPMIQEQRETAIQILKAGKDSGVASLEVTMDQKAGIDLGSEIDGIPIKVALGKSGKMTIKATYA